MPQLPRRTSITTVLLDDSVQLRMFMLCPDKQERGFLARRNNNMLIAKYSYRDCTCPFQPLGICAHTLQKLKIKHQALWKEPDTQAKATC